MGRSSNKKREVLEAVEDRFDEIENSALRKWNALDLYDPEKMYYEGFLEAVKYIRREYRRTLSETLFNDHRTAICSACRRASHG